MVEEIINSLKLLYLSEQNYLIERVDITFHVMNNIPEGRVNSQWIRQGEWRTYNKSSFLLKSKDRVKLY